MNKKTNKRKNFLINPPFQLSILGYFSILSLAIILIFYTSITIFFKKIQSDAIAAGLDSHDIFFTFLADQKGLMNKIFLITALISILIIFIGGIFISHKVAGPLYRLKMHLQKSKRADVSPISFRENDYFKDIEEEFNNFINRE